MVDLENILNDNKYIGLMKEQYKHLFPISLIVLGVISISGLNFFGSAALESAFWKQNVIIALLIIYCMLPPTVQRKKPVWLGVALLFLFFLFGGANLFAGIMLVFEKIALAILALLLSYRMWLQTWSINKRYMIFAVCMVLSVACLFPIENENIIGSGFHALAEWSVDRFTSDHGFHLFLGLEAILAGVSEFIISQNSNDTQDISESPGSE